jgi:hypothetical protein
MQHIACPCVSNSKYYNTMICVQFNLVTLYIYKYKKQLNKIEG